MSSEGSGSERLGWGMGGGGLGGGVSGGESQVDPAAGQTDK